MEAIPKMKITHLRLNHLVNPLGYGFDHYVVSYICEDTAALRQTSARVRVALDADMSQMIYDSGERADICSTGFELPVQTKPCTRYYWDVTVKADNKDEAKSETAWFETPGDGTWTADFITPVADKKLQVCMYKEINITKPVARARMYMTGLGVYEFYLNGSKQGDECLLPGFCPYDSYIPYQTFCPELRQGNNLLEVDLGDGWYKGWFGLRRKEENYGDRLAMTGELYIWYEDGSFEKINTDPTWKARKSHIVYSGIYPGEIYDAELDCSEVIDTEKIDLDKSKLCPRIDPQIVVNEEIRPVQLLHTPAGETVLDMGQNMVGWLKFRCDAPKGSSILFQFGEILQDGNFYNKNLRTAKAEFTYISDGTERVVRQHFTFYGYRFVKITGWAGVPDLNDFRGLVIHSKMEEIGDIETSDPLVNKLISNARWGMKGNFLDVPTDCPQRDERYGWTGDAQIFSGTACYFMDTFAFYAKYGVDVFCEQKRFNGAVPDTVPVCNNGATISTAWGEAGTIIPWNVYLHSGDKEILHRQYDSMKAWVDYMKGEDDRYGSKHLYQSGFHYGDWLALDGNVKGGVYGATDPFLISSAYYYYSTDIVAKAAGIIGNKEDEAKYRKLAREIHDAFVNEYFTSSGRLCVNTMTAYVVVLYMGLTPDYALEATRKGLMDKLRSNRYHLETGFVGTPYLCRVLSDNGMNDMAYHLLLEKGYPGWLYEVLMGATTIWERWNSILPDGKISGTEMNSMNHYSYGSIVEWMFRNMIGIRPCENGAGFKKFVIAPQPDYRTGWAKGSLKSASGLIKSEWKIEDGKTITVKVTVPFDTEAELVLPDADVNGLGNDVNGVQNGRNVTVHLTAGEHVFTYEPTVPYRKVYSLDSPFEELKENAQTRKILDEEFYPYHPSIPFEKELYTLRETLNGPFSNLPYDAQERIDKRLREVK